MIKSLQINNIALIDYLEITFDNGLTVLSGETGSGKSIIIDSLSFVLGERADKTLIKHGTDCAEVTAVFEIEPNTLVHNKLIEYGYGDDTEVLVSRKMSLAGKNEIRIQGKPSTLAILKEVCAELVDIFGQGQHLALLNVKNQLNVLDAFCKFDGVDVLLKNDLYPRLQEINKQLKQFGGSESERQRELDILKYQIDEIEQADVSQQEEDELIAKHKRLVNAEKINSALAEVSSLLSGDSGVLYSLSKSISALNSIAKFEDNADQLSSRLNAAQIEIDDIAETINSMLADTDFSAYEVDKIEARIDKYRELKRKYGSTVTEVLSFLSDIKARYDVLSNASEQIELLNANKNNLLKQMYQYARQKSEQRKITANKLAQNIIDELVDLGMKGTSFCVQFNDDVSFEDYAKNPSADGFDVVEFLMSANVGEPLKPLAKVISGGEMSRFMLAVKNITAKAEKIPTMVFDEIDTGISGTMAQMVANKLANVSNAQNGGYQCIVITHLPQIVAMADNNLYIEKVQNDGKTLTKITILKDEKQKAAEIARLMGGVGDSVVDSSLDLLHWCDDYKNKLHK